MRLLRSLADVSADLRGGAITIGNFDGVHAGHVSIVRRLLERARRLGRPALVFSFDPHPVRLLRPQVAPPPLTWTDRKAQLLDRLGVSALLAYPTDWELLRLSPEDFFRRIVVDVLNAKAVVEGANFRFGRGRAGDVDALRQLAAASGVLVDVVEPLVLEGEVVSSSRVRKLIVEGEVASAARLLTEPYRVRGLVVHGAARGAALGFPTANLSGIDTLLPAHGVYACLAWTGGRSFPAATNVGPNPTFGEQSLKVEAHLVGFQGSLYGQVIELEFLERLRGTESFPGPDALQHQLQRDVEQAAAVVRRAKWGL